MILNYLEPKEYLTAEEEKEILRACKQNNEAAKERLILSNIKYIYSEAKKLMNSGLCIDDLVMEGVYGLLQAINHYNENNGARFITYAYHWIRKSMLNFVYEHSSIVHFSSKDARKVAKLRKKCAELSYKNDLDIFKTVSEDCSCTENEAEELLNATAYTSLDAKVSEDGKNSRIEMLEDNSMLPEEECIKKDEQRNFLRALGQLSKIEQDVLIRHNGLFNKPIQNFEEIGGVYNRTTGRMQQIEKEAKLKLKEKFSA